MNKLNPLKVFTFLIVLQLTFFSVVNAQVSVLTQHNDLKRTGWNANETILNQSNVNTSRFGKILTRRVDDQIYAQPLVVSNLTINGKKRNVVFVITVNNTLYAFDADDASVTAPLWYKNLTKSFYRAPKNTDIVGACDGNYTDFTGKMGAVGTPVIDTTTRTLYVVTKSVTMDGSSFVQYII